MLAARCASEHPSLRHRYPRSSLANGVRRATFLVGERSPTSHLGRMSHVHSRMSSDPGGATTLQQLVPRSPVRFGQLRPMAELPGPGDEPKLRPSKCRKSVPIDPQPESSHIANYLGRMAKLLRSSLPDGFFHVVSRAVFGALLYLDDGDRRSFVNLFERCRERYRWECHAYCLMSTHYHLCSRHTGATCRPGSSTSTAATPSASTTATPATAPCSQSATPPA